MSGLVINTNLATIRALRNIKVTDREQMTSLERLSTGLRINRASDDPSGLVISEQLRMQIAALKQAVDNSENATNLIATTEAALQELSDLLISIKGSLTFAQSIGANSPDQIAAEQDAVDSAVAAVDRIVAATRFGATPLLNGGAAYVVGEQSEHIQNLRIRQVNFVGLSSRRFDFVLRRQAQPGWVLFGADGRVVTTDAALTSIPNARFVVSGTTPATLRISGPLGTRDVLLPVGASNVAVAMAVNDVAGFTGVWARGATGGEMSFRTVDFGSAQRVRIQIAAGVIRVEGTAGTQVYHAPTAWSDAGVDAVLSLGGQEFTGDGLKFDINTPFLNAEFSLSIAARAGVLGGNVAVGSTLRFSVEVSGLQYQLRERPHPTDLLSLGIENLTPGLLGFEPIPDIATNVAGNSGAAGYTGPARLGGFLSSIISGARNDLLSNPANASRIVDAAVEQVNRLRGFLGAIQAFTLEPNIRSTEVAIENLSASESSIRDLDFAEETSRFARNQILFQSGIAVLASANLVPQAVLALLGGR